MGLIFEDARANRPPPPRARAATSRQRDAPAGSASRRAQSRQRSGTRPGPPSRRDPRSGFPARLRRATHRRGPSLPRRQVAGSQLTPISAGRVLRAPDVAKGRRRACPLIRQQSESLGAGAAGLGVVHAKRLAVGVGDRKFLVSQIEWSDDGMCEPRPAAAFGSHIVAGPELTEALAADRELADQFGQLRIIDLMPGERS